MATVVWIGNAQNTAQVEKATVGAVATNGTLSATINQKTITYTCLSTDTIGTAVAAWLLLLQSSDAPPEFGEIEWTADTTLGTVTATAAEPGTPFAGMTGGLVFTAALGATLTQTSVTANSSQSDVNDSDNWLRGSATGLPVNGDDMVLANSDVPLLWNLDKLKSVRLNSFTRWQSFTGTVGLPEQNALGYHEYRQTYFQFLGPQFPTGSSGSSASSTSTGTLKMILGIGQTGTGPTRERYDVRFQQIDFTALASGPAADNYAIRVLGTNPANLYNVSGTSVGIATTDGETSALLTGTLGSGGTLALGPGVTCTTVTSTSGTLILNGCAPTTITLAAGSQLIQTTVAANPTLTYTTLTARGGSNVRWLSGSNVTTLTLETSSIFDKSGDVRAMTINSLTLDCDTCQVNDPVSSITFVNPINMRNALGTGPFILGVNRTVKIS